MKKKLIFSFMMLFILIVMSGCKCEHELDDGTISKESTCITEGEKTFKCQNCEYTKTEKIPVIEHIYENIVTKEPTEDEEGEKTFKCNMCDDSYTESIPKIEVIYEIGTRQNPYNFDDEVYIEDFTDGWLGYQGDATLKFSNYDSENYTFEVDIELGESASNSYTQPFYFTMILKYVSENYSDLDMIYDTTDPSRMSSRTADVLSLYAGGTGHTYLFIDHPTDIKEEPVYFTIYSYDSDNNESWIWIKLPD